MDEMTLNERALRILSGRERAAAIDMTESLRRGEARTLAAEEDGILIYHEQARMHMIWCSTEAAAQALLGGLAQVENLVVHTCVGLKSAERLWGLTEQLHCHQAVYPCKTIEEAPRQKDVCSIRLLGEREAEQVEAAYTHCGEGYVRERIGKGKMLGAFVDGALAGFIGEHIEGSMGLLEVFPDYRRHGIGEILERAQIARTIREGNIPFCQVVEGNTASERLQKKLGLEISRETVTWLWREET